MDTAKRLELLTSKPIEEVITRKDLKSLLETKNKPVAYDGFEPSGLAHIATGPLKALTIKNYQKAGVKYKILFADWHAWINDKMGGDLEMIRKTGRYFKKVYESLGVKNVEYVWAKDLVDDSSYWELVLKIAKNTTVNRAERCLTIMGRKKGELKDTAQYFYPMMQAADIFQLEVDICQLGIDQRKVNMLAREVGPQIGKWKPVSCHHHMLMGLKGPTKMGGYDEKYDSEISSKMSKSKPDTAIFIHDSKKEIERKLNGAYCPEKEVKGNPVIELCEYIVFPYLGKLEIERPEKYGGDITFQKIEELKKSFREGKLHPMDLKKGTAIGLSEIVAPARKYFEKHPGVVPEKNKVSR